MGNRADLRAKISSSGNIYSSGQSHCAPGLGFWKIDPLREINNKWKRVWSIKLVAYNNNLKCLFGQAHALTNLLFQHLGAKRRSNNGWYRRLGNSG